MGSRAHGGYALLIVLVALLIVGFLARDSIVQMFGGLTRGASKGESQTYGAPAPGADPGAGIPAPATPVERARGVEDVLRQHIEKGY